MTSDPVTRAWAGRLAAALVSAAGILSAVVIACVSAGTAGAAEPSAKVDPRLKGYRTPPGWRVEIAAAEPLVINPVTMTWGEDGRLYVVEWYEGRGPNDRIKVLTDTDGDGVFDKSDVYMDGLDLPAGLLFFDGWTYVTLNHDVVRFRDNDGDGKFEIRETIATGFGNDDSHHRVSGISLGPDGRLYLTTGDSDAHARGSDGSTATVLRCGGVFRCRPDGSQLENVAFGMRNPWGNVAFDDEFQIFHTDNDNEGSPGFTGCRLLHVVEGGDYGWRLREGARCCNPDFERATWNGGRPGRLGWITDTGRGAPAGLCVLNSASLPPSAHNLLVYPDVFRKKVRAYHLRQIGATYGVEQEFELLASDEGLFRPNDAEVGPDGALYILDWRTDSGGAGKLSGNGQTGRIYRMTWAGTEREPARGTFPSDRFTRLRKYDDKALIEALDSPDFGMRTQVSRELIRRGLAVNARLATHPDAAARRDLELHRSDLAGLVCDESKSIAARRHALGVLAAVASDPPGPGESGRWVDVIDRQYDDATLQRFALELRGRFDSTDDRFKAAQLLAWSDVDGKTGGAAGKALSDARVRRALAVALGRFRDLKREPENRDPNAPPPRLDDASVRRLQRAFSDFKNDLPKLQAAVRDALRDADEPITVELVARRLLLMGVESIAGDPFLRDGITRGLERLGPPALPVMTQAIASTDKTRAAAALFAIEGRRTTDALAVLLAEATTNAPLATTDRVAMFQALRELRDNVPPDRVTEWLMRNPKADPAARGAAIRLLRALGERAALAVSSLLPSLLDDPGSEVRAAALTLVIARPSREFATRLFAIAENAAAPSEERRLAVDALRAAGDKSAARRLLQLLKSTPDSHLKSSIFDALAALDFDAAATAARGLLNDPVHDLRRDSIRLLTQRPDTAREVARAFLDGKIPPDELSTVLEGVRRHNSPDLEALRQEIVKRMMLSAPTPEQMTQIRDYVKKGGDPARGRTLYLDEQRTACVTCHRMEGYGGSVGPDLTRVWETLSFEKRLESILEPSKEIKEGYATYRVATKDGRIATGLLASKGPDAVTLKDATGRELRIPTGEVDEQGVDPASLMPAGVAGRLTLSELADLLAFLGDREAQSALKSIKPETKQIKPESKTSSPATR